MTAGSTDNVPRLQLPTIEGSPPMSCLTSPTSESSQAHLQQQQQHNRHRRPRTPTVPDHRSGSADHTGAGVGAVSGSTAGKANVASEPSVDLELDFKVRVVQDG